jgi:hypothetical protein
MGNIPGYLTTSGSTGSKSRYVPDITRDINFAAVLGQMVGGKTSQRLV